MTSIGAPDVQIVLKVHRRKRSLHVSTEDLEEALRFPEDNITYFVQPDSDERISYLRFATCIFSILVELKRPCLDVVVSRVLCAREHSSLPIRLDGQGENEENESHDRWLNVAAEGYEFGDTDADFLDKYDVVAVGGTFDRLHAGHRLLLTAASWAARQKLVIGVTGESLLRDKQHKELIASFPERSRSAMTYARQVKPSLQIIDVVELHDQSGPTTSDPTINALVVSRETVRGASRINEVRTAAGLKPMSIIIVDVIDTAEEKLSSSVLRKAEYEKGAVPRSEPQA